MWWMYIFRQSVVSMRVNFGADGVGFGKGSSSRVSDGAERSCMDVVDVYL